MTPAESAAWVAVVVYAVTCVATLLLLFARFDKPPKKADPVLDSAIRWLTRGLLVETGAAVLGWIVVKPPIGPAQLFTLRTNATASASEKFPGPLESGRNGFVSIPPHQELGFISASAVRWTNDPLDAIEHLIAQVPFEWDFRDWVTEYRTLGRDEAKFADQYVKRVYDALVERHLAAQSDGGPKSAALEAQIRALLQTELFPRLRDADGHPEHMRQLIDCRQTSPLEIRRPFWKRVIALSVADTDPVFGPYFSIDAEGNKPPQKSSEFPLSTANVGSLVAIQYTETGGVWSARTDPTAFCRPGDSIKNASNEIRWYRLVMNDNVPEDNGPGYADVIVQASANIK